MTKIKHLILDSLDFQREKPKYMAHNFRTGQAEPIRDRADWRDYIPQDSASQTLYTSYLQDGNSPAEAALLVLMDWWRNTDEEEGEGA